MGFAAALTFKAAVDDPKRFQRSKTVAAHLGLTPRRYQSGEKDNPGHISKAGDVEVRSALVLAANTIMNGRGPNQDPIDWVWDVPRGGKMFSHVGNDVGVAMPGVNPTHAVVAPRIIAWTLGDLG